MTATSSSKSARLLVLVALGLLAACARSGPPAPVELRGITGGAPPPRVAGGAPGVIAAPLTPVSASALPQVSAGALPQVSAGALPRGGADGHLVGRGETLYGVARQYDVPVRALIDANGLQPPYQLVIGQRLTIPQQRTHLVVAGDTLYSISRRYGVDMSEVVHLNSIAPPYAVKLGEKLLLPAPVMVAAVAAPGVPTVSVPSAGAAPVVAPPAIAAFPLSPVAPPVGSAAAPPTGVSVAVTPLAPPVPSVATPPLVGAVPVPPLGDSLASETRPPSRPPVSARREPLPAEPSPDGNVVAGLPAAGAALAPSPPIEPVPEAAAPPAGEPATPLPAVPSSPQQSASVLEPPKPPPRAARTFLWPVRGRVLATFGERGGGQHNDGINIAATRGTPVHAAENGVVAYAGNEIRGFGNLLLIRHADGYMTAYAHNEALLVQRGDVVRRGQVVARVGATGNVAQPQLHFEVRKGTQAIDPESVLGNPAQANAS